MKKSILFCFFIFPLLLFGQGYNHQWLLGSYNFLQDPKGRVLIDSNNFNPVPEFRKMVFKGTQGNICDANGNFLMSSNGVWIANANNDTMMNGSGLNPGGITPNWAYGLPILYNNIIIPFPWDSTKYILFHHSATFNGTYSPCYELFSSVIDISLDSGLGTVVQKNNIVFQDTLNFGIGACKHSNGRDWWIVMLKDSSEIAFEVLVTDSGISSITTQHLNYSPLPWGNSAQLTFSQNGNLFATTTYYPEKSLPMDSSNSSVVLFDFDRCSGNFSNPRVVKLIDNAYLWGLAFSPSGKYVYACSSNYIYQIDVDSLTSTIVATYDGFISPPTDPCCPSTFFGMYLAANGKIYVTSGSSVQHITEMNYPDSADTACDVQQHSIDLVNYLYLRSVPNHPNYYLGCDTPSGCPCLYAGIKENEKYDFHFRIYPNPITGNSLHIGYLLPQNKAGVFSIYDVTGKIVFKYNLPQWSNEQVFNLPKLSGGVYNCIIKSNNFIATKKLIVIDEE